MRGTHMSVCDLPIVGGECDGHFVIVLSLT